MFSNLKFVGPKVSGCFRTNPGFSCRRPSCIWGHCKDARRPPPAKKFMAVSSCMWPSYLAYFFLLIWTRFLWAAAFELGCGVRKYIMQDHSWQIVLRVGMENDVLFKVWFLACWRPGADRRRQVRFHKDSTKKHQFGALELPSADWSISPVPLCPCAPVQAFH